MEEVKAQKQDNVEVIEPRAGGGREGRVFNREVSDPSPQHKEASDEIKAHVEEVEAQKQDYTEVIVLNMQVLCFPNFLVFC